MTPGRYTIRALTCLTGGVMLHQDGIDPIEEADSEDDAVKIARRLVANHPQVRITLAQSEDTGQVVADFYRPR